MRERKTMAKHLLLAVLAILCVSCSKRPEESLPRTSFIVDLPDNWYEADSGLPKAYRMKGENTGWLHVSLMPAGDTEPLTNALDGLLKSTGLDTGEQIELLQDKTAFGPMAISLHKSESRGLLQFWLIDAGEVWVFASYTMGALDTATEEMAQAQQIVRHLRIEDQR